jgi:hypothetical protein
MNQELTPFPTQGTKGQDLNLYRYVRGNPPNLTDPYGLDSVGALKAALENAQVDLDIASKQLDIWRAHAADAAEGAADAINPCAKAAFSAAYNTAQQNVQRFQTAVALAQQNLAEARETYDKALAAIATTTVGAGSVITTAFSTPVTVGSVTGGAGLGVALVQTTGIGLAGATGYGTGVLLDYASGGRLSNGAAFIFRPITNLFY